MKQNKGFTILELVMIILLISILAVVIIPRIGGIYPFRLDGAAQKMLSDVKYAQRLAMAGHQIYGVLFEPAEEKYVVCDSNGNPVDNPYRPGNPFIVDYDDDEQFSGVDLYSANFEGGLEVRFNFLGAPLDGSDAPLSNAGSVAIRCGGEEVVIQVTPRTGRIEIE